MWINRQIHETLHLGPSRLIQSHALGFWKIQVDSPPNLFIWSGVVAFLYPSWSINTAPVFKNVVEKWTFALYVFCGADGDPDFFVTLTVWRLILTSVYFSHIHVYVYIYNTFLHTLIYIYTYSHCEGHGQCNCGRCDCKVGWYGKKCEHPRSCPLSTEESIRKCQGSATLPCSGRGKWGSQALPPTTSHPVSRVNLVHTYLI